MPSAYNAILDRPGLNAFRAIVSTYHLKVKSSTACGVREVHGDQDLVRHCYNIALQGAKPTKPYSVEGLDTCNELAEG